MPQTKEVHKKYMRERRKVHTEDLQGSQDHPVMKYLIPGEKREKMEKIVLSLKNHNQLENVYLGCGSRSLPFDTIAELLEVTKVT